MSYRIRFTKRARGDIDRLLGSLAERSPDLADRLEAEFERSVTRLERFPLSCGLAYESPQFVEDVRHLLFGLSKKRRYRALFIIREDDEEIILLAVAAPGEEPIRPEDLDIEHP